MLSIPQTVRQSLFLSLCCVLLAAPVLADESSNKSADALTLQANHGYLLIRIVGTSGERITRFDLTHVDTGDVVKTRSDMYKSAGPNAWMFLLPVPAGRYFWSKYSSDYSFGLELSRSQDPMIGQTEPSSASDTFEVVPDVINYAGDWKIRISSDGPNRRWTKDVSQNVKTLQRLFERFPEYTEKYEIYLSMMGKEAISFVEFQRIIKQHSGS